MAIIRTDSTSALVFDVADELPIAPSEVAVQAIYMLDRMARTNGLYDSGSQPGLSWEIRIGDSNVSYARIYDDYLYNSWTFNGSSQYALYGSDLTNNTPGAGGVASRYGYSESKVSTRNEPGFIGREDYKYAAAANIEFNRGVPDSLIIRDAVYSESEKRSGTGFSGVPSGHYSSSYSATRNFSYKFEGVAEYNAVTGGTLPVTTYAYSEKETKTWRDEGAWKVTAIHGSSSKQFSLTSAEGLTSRLVGGKYELSGSISSLTLQKKQVSWHENNGNESFSRYYSYVDSAEPDDAIDLAILNAFFSDRSNQARLALEAELLKGDDTIVVTDHLYGGIIRAGAGNDLVIGGRADDEIWGGAGADVIKGGNGKDDLQGGLGNDLLDGGSGHDGLSGDDGDDRLLGGAGNDWLDAGTGDDYLDGGAGNDELYGGDGADVLKGGAGQDLLKGNAGDDVIEGGAGNDYIEGGAGRDIMSGGTGIDGFAFYAGDSGDGALSLGSLDQIKGFSVSQDRIQLDFFMTAGDIQLLGQGASYEALLADAEALDSRIVVGYDGANTYVFVDMDGNGALDLAVQLVGIKGDAVAQALQFEHI